MSEHTERAVAIVGLGAIFPDAPDSPTFWKNILNRRYSITETPADRWSIEDYYDPDPLAPDKTYSKIGGWVKDFHFNWQHFRIPPKVASYMDRSQQWAVTIAEQALADYGYPQRPLDTERTGVILGTAMGGEIHYWSSLRIYSPEYAHALERVEEFRLMPEETRRILLEHWRAEIERLIPPITEDTMPGELANIVSGRVANIFNLRGPNFISDAACAASLAAVETAIELLVKGEVDAVLTGGVDRNMGANAFVKFCKIGALSPTGSRPFGEGADGFVMGEGAAMFLVKRLADAERDGDRVYAVIRGAGGSSDGKGKGIYAPNPVGQKLAVERAWEAAGLDPATATLIEAHGTSTRVGDLAEAESLSEVFQEAPRRSIGLGSVKSNIGHLKSGAGAAGLLKAVLSVYHKILPPTLNAERPNPNIDFDHSPFYLLNECREWNRSNGTPRRAGVCANGFGGTNFHVVLEEHIPGSLTNNSRSYASVQLPQSTTKHEAVSKLPIAPDPLPPDTPPLPKPLRGMLAVGGQDPQALKQNLANALERVRSGWAPPLALPDRSELLAPERLVIDFGDRDELLDRMAKALKAMEHESLQLWKSMQAQGVFRGSGPKPGKLAFLFTGQGSQYLNMGRQLMQVSPLVVEQFQEADRTIVPILGRPLTEYIFVDSQEPDLLAQGEANLMQTAICQPAVLTLDIALYRMLESYGFQPELVMGHSLGEYAALIASGAMRFSDALTAAAARGREMAAVKVDDNGWMAAVMAPYEVIEGTLKETDGYVVAANINSHNQCVIGGASQAVESAIGSFQQKGYQAFRIPVSHAFHTRIVAPAAPPLRKVLDRLTILPPKLPMVTNVTGEFYPVGVEAMKDNLEKHIASPVQWMKGLETLYEDGARMFVEVGPKKALRGLAEDVLGDRPGVATLFTCHPKVGELPSFNQALCGLFAAGYLGILDEANGQHEDNIGRHGMEVRRVNSEVSKPVAPAITSEVSGAVPLSESEQSKVQMAVQGGNGQKSLPDSDMLAQVLAQSIQQALGQAFAPLSSLIEERGQEARQKAYYRNEIPAGSVVISGTGLGLPGTEKSVMDPENALRILHGEQFVDQIPERFRKRMVGKRIVRLVKSEDGSGSFETINDLDNVIRLAGRPGSFNLSEEYGISEKLISALDSTTQLAMAAGIDALREAGIPLVQAYRLASTGKQIPDRWMLPEALRDETGVIFASAFPGVDELAQEFERYFTWENRVKQLELVEDLMGYTNDPDTLRELKRRVDELNEALEREPYEFDRNFLFRVLSMGHSQFAEYIGARGPNTQVNSACASTPLAIALAEDWIRTGRCRRVVVIAGDNVTSDHLLEWVGAGFLALGAAATDDRVEEACVPFDRRRHGTIMGMGACAMVVESEDAVRERGMRAIVELLSAETRNSAFHPSRLEVEHIGQVMDDLVTAAEQRFGVNRLSMASQMVFMSHETFTPARGGSASAEVVALRRTFGDAANEVVVANTKGFTGHAMGVGVEDVISIKILEHGIVPPVPNFRVEDPNLGLLNLSRGWRYPVQYALHLSAGFGSQIAMTLLRRIPGGLDRVDDRLTYQRWLDGVSGYDRAELEVVKRTLRIKAQGAPKRAPEPSSWKPGTGPIVRAAAFGDGYPSHIPPVHRQYVSAADWKPATPVREPQKATFVEHPQEIKEQRQAVVEEPAIRPPAPSLEPSPQAPTPAPSVDPVLDQVLEIVAGKTGYPKDMLELDLDLEADLGIDTVKQAETFQAIREAFSFERLEGLKLRDYPTLAHVIEFVYKMRPDLASQPLLAKSQPELINQTLPVTKEVAPSPVAGSQAPLADIASAPSADKVVDQVLEIVAEKTGYPVDMLELDLDLEADLGIDTVKQAETFLAIRETFGFDRPEGLRLRDYPTLAHVVEFVHKMRPDLTEQSQAFDQLPANTEERSSPVVSDEVQTADPVVDQVMAIVAEKTGYPVDMLELDLDLEADLGIDTVKQAETFLAIRETFGFDRPEGLRLRDYPTLAHVIEFVHKMRPDLADHAQPAESQPPETGEVRPIEAVEVPDVAPLRPSAYPLENADRFPRRVPIPVLRPSIELCKLTGVRLEQGSRVIIMPDEGGIGTELAGRLEERGVSVLRLETGLGSQEIETRVKGWLEEGPVQGVFWLPALDVEPPLEELDLDAWREHNRRRVKSLYVLMRMLYAGYESPGTFLVVATRMGGLHGYGPEGASAPLGGAVTGFAKAFRRERPGALVKAVDFVSNLKDTGEAAVKLIEETLKDPGVVEIGYRAGLRYSISLEEEQLVQDGRNGEELGPETVFLVTGAAGGITSAIVSDLASAAGGGHFYLLDLIPEPSPDDAYIALFRRDREALKVKLIDTAKAAGEKLTPAKIDKRILDIERAEALLHTIETIQNSGGQVVYRIVDMLDAGAVDVAVEEVRQREGRIDVLVHAAGVEISKVLPEKDPQQFDLVFGVKADGLFNLLHSAKGMPIGALLTFSSVAGRFGNAGQTDYSAANDLLCKVVSSLRSWRPETRGIAVDWTAWSGAGMATRGSIPKIMEVAGIDMLPLEIGVPTVRRELLHGSFWEEVVVASRLGILLEEVDETGGIDLDRAANALGERKPPFVMVGKVKAAKVYGGLEIETTLDPCSQPFLHDHAMDGTPLLPGVMGMEAFAELATALAELSTGGQSEGQQLENIIAVEQVDFWKPFKFYRMQPQTLLLSTQAKPIDDGLSFRTVMRSRTQPAKPGLPVQEKIHFTGQVHLAAEPSDAPTAAFEIPKDGWSEVTAESIYGIYFHGPAYRVLDNVMVSADRAVGKLANALPPDTNPARAASLIAPRLVELIFQTAGIWEIQTNDAMALPSHLDALNIYQLPEEPAPELFALVQALDNGASFDAQVVDQDGKVYLSVKGYRTVRLPVSEAV